MSVKLIQGDCREVLKTLETDSIDAVVTDPPYGIGFMGKEWDTFAPRSNKQPERLMKHEPIISDNPNLNGRRRSPAISPSQIAYDESLSGRRGFQTWTEEWAHEVLRVLKPGGHLLCCGAPRSYHRMACGIEDAGFEVRDAVLWLFGQGFPKSHNLNGDNKGWGTALKPAWEPIVVARKPLIGTVAANVAHFGTGAFNINGSRILTGDSLGGGAQSPDVKRATDGWHRPWMEDPVAKAAHAARVNTNVETSERLGRWPANVTHDGSECVVAGFSGEAGTASPVHKRNGDKFRNAFGGFAGDVDEEGSTFHADSGSAARFFYVPKADRADRDDGLQAKGRNTHPTVKPTDLMRYLCALVTPPGGLVLDPFMGSGSTGRGAQLGGFSFIGIEKEAEYVEIARARITAIWPLFTEVSA